MKRQPAVAGFFYSHSPRELKLYLSDLIKFSSQKVEAKGIIVPHAGYMYSGWIAGKVYGKIEPPDVAIILGPNHTGLGKKVAIFNGEAFVTPLDEAKVNKVLVPKILEKIPLVQEDVMAHLHEHSIEVQIPFLQYLNPYIEIVPICLRQISLEEIRDLGQGLAEVVKDFILEEKKKVLFIASTDFSHYLPHEEAKKRDSIAIEKILELSEEKLIEAVIRYDISMCGVIPVAVTLVACKGLNAKKAELVDYCTSGDIIKDYSSVVGYGGIIIY